MLEIERQSREAPDGSGGTGEQGESQRRGLLRRARRAVSRPAGPPESGTAAPAAKHEPAQPAFSAAQRGDKAPAAQAPSATFQPPAVVFQPPDVTPARQQPSGPPAGQAAGAAAGKGGGSTRNAGAAKSAPAKSAPAKSAPAKSGTAKSGGAAKGGASGQADAGQGPSDTERLDDGESGSRRRRRGGRGHGKRTAEDAAEPGQQAEAEPAADAEADVQEGNGPAQGADDAEGGTGPRRRRRRRRSGSGGESGEAAAADDPPNTVVHVRQPRQASDNDDVRGVKGSTRLEAKRQRRREGRESGRRRPPIITESEFLARREAVQREMVVRQRGDRTQIAVLEDGILVEHYVDKASHQSYVGNVYLGKVQNVLPSMEAAFVDIGKGRNAVLYAGEVNFDASGLEGESKRIESALKSGQSILVQVTKDPIGHKGARLTSQVSLPGRYLVYVPGASMTGISRKLPDTERSRLKQILKQVMPEGAGVIVRTAAEGASEEELARDVSRLAAQWEAIERKSKTASAPELLYSEPDLTIRVVRDIFNEDFSKLVIASDGEWDMVGEYVRYVAPHLAERLERYQDAKDVFSAYRIDEQLAKALERKVWLPSGGSLVIDTTEAMTVIDVNTGKFTGHGGNLEQTVTRNNLEAAEEIVRQLRLRDVGGIIVIDFIDMVLESNRELVLRRLLECLARDRTKHQVAEVTSLGLVQMTRKRVGSGLLEAFSVTCEHCNGRGVLVSMEPVDHTPARGREDDGKGKDDGKGGKSGRGSRGGRQSKGDQPKADQPKGDNSRAGTRGADGSAPDAPAASATADDAVAGDAARTVDAAAADTSGQTIEGSHTIEGGRAAEGEQATGGGRRRSGSRRASTRKAGAPATEAGASESGTAQSGTAQSGTADASVTDASAAGTGAAKAESAAAGATEAGTTEEPSAAQAGATRTPTRGGTARVGAVQTGVTRVRATRSGAVKADAGADTAKADTAKTDTATADAAGADAAGADTASADTAKADAGADTAKADTAGADTTGAGTTGAGTARVGTARAGTTRAGTARAGTARAGTAKAGTAKAEAAQGDANKSAAKGGTAEGDVAKGETAQGDGTGEPAAAPARRRRRATKPAEANGVAATSTATSTETPKGTSAEHSGDAPAAGDSANANPQESASLNS